MGWGAAGAAVNKTAKDRYIAMRNGLLFSVTHQTPGTGITGQTSYVATTPTFLLYQSASTRTINGLSLWLSQMGTVAGGTITIAIGIASTSLYSSGGTALTPNSRDAAQSKTPSASFRYNPTATGAPTFIWSASAPATLGTITTFDFEDGISIGTTGSIAVYTFAATTGPTWALGVEWWEEA